MLTWVPQRAALRREGAIASPSQSGNVSRIPKGRFSSTRPELGACPLQVQQRVGHFATVRVCEYPHHEIW